MDFNLKQWRRHGSDQEPETPPSSSKLPRLYPHHSSPPPPSALPLFLSQTHTTPNLSDAYSSEYSTSNTARTGDMSVVMGSSFSSGQWQELELQALIFRHMAAGADVPPHLLRLLHSASPYYPHHHCYYQPAPLAHPGYWGKGAVDPEPGRCRRTDGKKWRCSRDVVAAGQKYCERHVHRGKNRSRKPVEITVSNNEKDSFKTGANRFTLSGPSVDLLQHNPRRLSSIESMKCTHEAPNEGGNDRTLRRFFDDWPGSLHEPENAASSATSLSISMPGNPSSDFSLKLGTGGGDERGARAASDGAQLNWGMAWEANRVGPMGGPLAEALR